MSIIKSRKIFYAISAIAMLASFLALGVWGLKPNIELTGGSLAEYRMSADMSVESVRSIVEGQGITGASVVTSTNGVLMRMRELAPEEHAALTKAVLKQYPGSEELRFEAIGPSISAELRSKATIALIATLLLVLAYVAWAYRNASARIQSWKYGALVVMTGLHDAILPMGIFAALGHFRGTEVGGSFIAAILTILGYSINNVIVIFDRVRENFVKEHGTVEELVEKGIRESAMRSINTTVATMLALGTVYFFGGDSTKDFLLALMIGLLAGAYSAIFLAAPLLVDWKKK